MKWLSNNIYRLYHKCLRFFKGIYNWVGSLFRKKINNVNHQSHEKNTNDNEPAHYINQAQEHLLDNVSTGTKDVSRSESALNNEGTCPDKSLLSEVSTESGANSVTNLESVYCGEFIKVDGTEKAFVNSKFDLVFSGVKRVDSVLHASSTTTPLIQKTDYVHPKANYQVSVEDSLHGINRAVEPTEVKSHSIIESKKATPSVDVVSKITNSKSLHVDSAESVLHGETIVSEVSVSGDAESDTNFHGAIKGDLTGTAFVYSGLKLYGNENQEKKLYKLENGKSDELQEWEIRSLRAACDLMIYHVFAQGVKATLHFFDSTLCQTVLQGVCAINKINVGVRSAKSLFKKVVNPKNNSPEKKYSLKQFFSELDDTWSITQCVAVLRKINRSNEYLSLLKTFIKEFTPLLKKVDKAYDVCAQVMLKTTNMTCNIDEQDMTQYLPLIKELDKLYEKISAYKGFDTLQDLLSEYKEEILEECFSESNDLSIDIAGRGYLRPWPCYGRRFDFLVNSIKHEVNLFFSSHNYFLDKGLVCVFEGSRMLLHNSAQNKYVQVDDPDAIRMFFLLNLVLQRSVIKVAAEIGKAQQTSISHVTSSTCLRGGADMSVAI